MEKSSQLKLKHCTILGLLSTIGCIQMTGDLFGSAPLKAIGTALAASPAPKVFTAHQGFETYSSRFYVNWTDQTGAKQHTLITKERYASMRGPYNRRNAYGAAISYGPVLRANPYTRDMFEQVANYALCKPKGLLHELNIHPIAGTPVTVELKPREKKSRDPRWQLTYTANCKKETSL